MTGHKKELFKMTLVDLASQNLAFLQKTVGDRDASHGVDHMMTVGNNAITYAVFSGETDPTFLRDVALVGFGHDVRDHKYTNAKEIEKEQKEFLLSQVSGHHAMETVKKLMLTMDCVSFSKEKKARADNRFRYFEELLGTYYTRVRDYVSDADKMEALGKIGLERCVAFTMHRQKKTEIDDAVRKNVIDHADEKLLRLVSDQYIVTPYGRMMGRLKEVEFKEALKSL